MSAIDYRSGRGAIIPLLAEEGWPKAGVVSSARPLFAFIIDIPQAVFRFRKRVLFRNVDSLIDLLRSMRFVVAVVISY